jgi:hypothetical protein
MNFVKGEFICYDCRRGVNKIMDEVSTLLKSKTRAFSLKEALKKEYKVRVYGKQSFISTPSSLGGYIVKLRLVKK